MRSEARMRTMMSEKYCPVTFTIGTRSKTALMASGSREVTVMLTGRRIHQIPIQKMRPMATA